MKQSRVRNDGNLITVCAGIFVRGLFPPVLIRVRRPLKRMSGEGEKITAIARATGLTRPTVYAHPKRRGEDANQSCWV